MSDKKYKKKILFFIESLQCGGAERSLVSLLQTLDYSKLDVDLMLLTEGGIFREYVPNDVNVILLPGPKGIRQLWHKTCMMLFSLAIRIIPIYNKRHGAESRWIFEHSSLETFNKVYDVAIAYQQGFPTYYVATKVFASTKLAWVNVDLVSSGYNEDFNQKYYNRFSRIVTVSDKLRSMLVKRSFMPSVSLSVIYDILNVDLIKRMSSAPTVTFDATKGLKFVTVGRMAKQKNYPLAVETARFLKDKGLVFQWIFVGGGSELGQVKTLISRYGLEDYVFPVGEKSNPYPYMRDCDIYVHSASFEGFGLTIAEAKILGKPVVSTNFKVVYDQIIDGENGLIAEMTPESLGERILMLVNDNCLREKIQEAVLKETNSTAYTETAKFYKLIGL